MKREKLAAIFFAAVMVLGMTGPAGAVDGTIEINQAKVLAAGGFPYQIAASGSYRLTGNLTAPANTDGIDVSPPNVTIDLNGFSINGSGSSQSTAGVDAPGEQNELTVENGTVTGFGFALVVSGNAIVKSVHADGNVAGGIVAAPNSVIEGCTANNHGANQSIGILCGSGCKISGNTANSNSGFGIESIDSGVIEGNTANSNGEGIKCSGSGCLILHNVVNLNTSVGIDAADSTTSYGENVISGGTPTPVHSGTSMGAGNTNLCNGTRC